MRAAMVNHSTSLDAIAKSDQLLTKQHQSDRNAVRRKFSG
jgi:hypothetical protein